MSKKKAEFFNEFSKMDNVYFNYQKAVAYYQARFGLAYPVPSFHKWLASTNAANVAATDGNEKNPLIKPKKNPQPQEVLMTNKQLKAE